MVVISERKQEQEEPVGAISPLTTCLFVPGTLTCLQCSKGQNHHYLKAEHYPTTGTLHVLSLNIVVHSHCFYHLPTASTQSTFSFHPNPIPCLQLYPHLSLSEALSPAPRQPHPPPEGCYPYSQCF